MGLGEFLMYLFLGHTILHVALAEFNIKEGETGKYRWYDEVSKRYRPCCYCPNEALLYRKCNDAFQVPFDYTDFCNGSVETVSRINQTLYRYPFCFCKEAYDLQTEFIGCILPNTTDVLWNCDNGFLFPNVSVYTTCQPQCKYGNERPVTGYNSLNFRCNELKEWEQNTADVVCKNDNLADDHSVKVLIIWLVSVCVAVLVVFPVIIYCFLRKWKRKFWSPESPSETCFESESSISSRTNTLPHGSSEIFVETQSHRESMQPVCNNNNELDPNEGNQGLSEEEPFLGVKINDSLVNVKSAGMNKHIQGGVTYYNVALGSKVVIASIPVSDPTDFSIDRGYDEQKLNHFIINSVKRHNAGKYQWIFKDNNKTCTGSFHLNVEDDRKAPQGDSGSYPSLQGNSLITESLRTLEEPFIEELDRVNIDDKTVVTCHRPVHSSDYSLTASIYSGYSDGISVDMLVQECQCINCECKLFDLMEDCRCNQGLVYIYLMLDPQKRDTAKWWKGFVMFYQKKLDIERCKIDSISYHKKGDPEDGHMLYILQNILLPHGFTIRHIVYYFSRECSYRRDVLKEVEKFHRKCQFCDKYLNSLI